MEEWRRQVIELSDKTLFPRANRWCLNVNILSKPRKQVNDANIFPLPEKEQKQCWMKVRIVFDRSWYGLGKRLRFIANSLKISLLNFLKPHAPHSLMQRIRAVPSALLTFVNPTTLRHVLAFELYKTRP